MCLFSATTSVPTPDRCAPPEIRLKGVKSCALQAVLFREH